LKVSAFTAQSERFNLKHAIAAHNFFSEDHQKLSTESSPLEFPSTMLSDDTENIFIHPAVNSRKENFFKR
jgi:hypothetical protein